MEGFKDKLKTLSETRLIFFLFQTDNAFLALPKKWTPGIGGSPDHENFR